MLTVFVIGTAVLGLYMAWTIGANDVANSMADAVGSRACTIKQAVIAAGICEFAGAVLVGAHVTDTVRKGIVHPNFLNSLPDITSEQAAALLVLLMMSSLLAASFWLHLSTFFGVPVSTTHSIVGAIAGCGVVAAGWSAVNWPKMGQIVSSWFVSPVLGGVLGALIFFLISRLILQHYRPVRMATRYAPFLFFFTFFVVTAAIVFKGLKHIITEENIVWLTGWAAVGWAFLAGFLAAFFSKWYLCGKLEKYARVELSRQLEIVEKVFAPLVFITSCTVAFAHGANDVANSVGPLAAVVGVFRNGTVTMKVPVPVWVLMLGGGGIVVGLAMYGYRVMTTVGEKITRITPSRGLAADIAAMTTVLACSRLKLPVSTTHTLVGAIMGVAFARGGGAVNKMVARKIFTSWLITVPVAALISITIFLLGRWLAFDYITEVIAGLNG